MRKITFLLLSCAAVASVSRAAVVVSDGPAASPAQGQDNGNSKVVTTDGPREWTQATKNGVHLYGQWVVESEGPGTAKVVGAPADPAASPFPSPIAKEASSSGPAPVAVSNTPSNKIVVSDGPGTATAAPAFKAKRRTKVARAKKTMPAVDAETSTLAPMIPTKAQPAPSSVSGWKMATFLLSFALIVLLSLTWTTRKRTF